MVKYVFSILLSVVFLVTGLPAEAARNDNYPTPLYCYVLSNGRVTTYVRNSTASVSGYIDGGVDQVQMNNIYPSVNWVYGGYPTSRGRKWAWFRVSDVIYDYNYQMKKTKALRTAPAYRKKERGQTIGSVYVNDVIYVVSEYGDLAQIIYPIYGGYKLGWVEKSVVDWGSRPAPQPAEYYPTGNIVNVANGTYKISSAANSNIGLDLDGAIDENGANLHLWYRADTPQQKFVIENCGDGYYSLRPSYTDKKIDVMGGNPNNGTNVRLWTSNGTDAQKWRFIDAGNGYVYIESKLKPGLSLDCQGARVDAGVNVQLWLRGNVAWHKWKLERLYTEADYSTREVTLTSSRQVVDTFNGVEAIYSKNYTDPGDATYNCAALVKKYYAKHYGVTPYNLLPRSRPIVNGRSLNKVTSPKVGDIVGIKTSVGVNGHWAIVKAVNGNQVTLFEQNWKYNGKTKINRKIDISSANFYRL